MQKIIIIFIASSLLFMLSCKNTKSKEHNFSVNNKEMPFTWVGDHLCIKAIVFDSIEGHFCLDNEFLTSAIDMDFIVKNTDTTKMGISHHKLSNKYHANNPIKIIVNTDTILVPDFRLENIYHFTRDSIVNGILGYEFFNEKIVMINFENKTFQYLDNVHNYDDYFCVDYREIKLFRNSRDRTTKVVDIMMYNGSSKPVNGAFIIDLGAAVNLLTANFINKTEKNTTFPNSLTEQAEIPITYSEKSIKFNVENYNIDSLFIGNFKALDNSLFECRFQYNANKKRQDGHEIGERVSNKFGGVYYDGILGLPFLERLNIIIDNKNNKFYFKPIKNPKSLYFKQNLDSVK